MSHAEPAIATFTAAAVALGLLRCSGHRERAASIAVALFATLGSPPRS
jgi:hypothetical protein